MMTRRRLYDGLLLSVKGYKETKGAEESDPQPRY